jgi:hypothetical protein
VIRNFLQIDKTTTSEHNPPHVLGALPFLGCPEPDSGFFTSIPAPGKPRFAFSEGEIPMKLRVARVVVGLVSLVLSLTQLTIAQTSAQTASALPRLVRFGGTLKDLNGSAVTGVVGITFALYSEKNGGSPLWLETQNVAADSNGHYTVLLGATKPDGLPAELFTSEQARWVGVQISGQAERARVLLVSAPYALKAGDAETIGGLPPSAFVLAAPANSGGAIANGGGATASSSASLPPPASSDVTTTGGTVNAIPLFSTATNIQNSLLTQTGTTTVNVGGKLNLPPAGTATASAGFNSRPQDFVASVFDSGTATAVPQTFQWQAEPLNNDKSTATGTLSLLYAAGTATPAETGLKISGKGLFTFATGQTFPGTGAGTITGITTAAGSGLAGGGVKGTLALSVPAAGITNAMLAHPSLTVTAGTGLTGGGLVALGNSITLNVNTAKIPQLSTANTFVGNQTVTGTVTATSFTGNGAGLTNVTASNSKELGGLASSAYAQLAAANKFTTNQTVNGTGGVGSYGLTVNQPSQSGILIEGPITGPGAGLDLKTVGTGGKQWEILATGNTASQGVGKLNIRDVNSSTDVLTIDASDTVNVNTNLNVAGGSITLTGNQTVNGTVEATSTASAVIGNSSSTIFAAVSGGGPAIGVFGNASGASGSGVYGTGATGVLAVSTGSGPGGSFTGFSGPAGSGLGGSDGVDSTGGNFDPDTLGVGSAGVVGIGGTGPQAGGAGVMGMGGTNGGFGGSFTGGAGGDGISVYVGHDGGFAGNFIGDLYVSGAISAGTKDFKIDHPLDPANKYLFHASVESSEMMNIYTGNVTTDGQGYATVQLPEWFEVLNTNFRYQLTVIGQFAQAIIGRKIENNRLEIRTSAPNVEVSWQVTGVRQDAYAKAHPLVVEQEKDERLRGFYIHPELYGATAEKQIEWARHPQMMKKIKEMQARQLAAGQKKAVAQPVLQKN